MVPNAVTLVIEREDHTVGNLLRMCVARRRVSRAAGVCALSRGRVCGRELLEDKEVLFSGYRVPHPLEPAIQLKVQTRSPNPGPVQVVDSALIALNAELKTFKDRFETELRAKQAESQGVPGMMQAQGLRRRV